eukprot:s1542_g2.t1
MCASLGCRKIEFKMQMGCAARRGLERLVVGSGGHTGRASDSITSRPKPSPHENATEQSSDQWGQGRHADPNAPEL